MTIEEIVNDPCASYWLRCAVRELSARDPLDALYDAECLLEIAKDRLAAVEAQCR